MKRLFRVMTVLSALLVLLLVLSASTAWLLRDDVARSLANRLLQNTNLHVTGLGGMQPALARATVREMTVELKDSGQLQEFSDIALTFTLAGLRQSRIESLRIGRAELDIPFHSGQPAVTSDSLRLTDLTEQIRQAPIQSLHIDQLLLHTRPMSVSLYWQPDRLTGEIGDEETGITLDIAWHPASTDDGSQSSLTGAAPFTARLQAQTGTVPTLHLDADVEPMADKVELQAFSRVEIDSARAILDELIRFTPLPALPVLPLSGSIELTARTHIPDALQIPPSLQLAATINAGGTLQLLPSLLADSGLHMVTGHWQEPVTLVLTIPGRDEPPDVRVSGAGASIDIRNADLDTVSLTDSTITVADHHLHCAGLSLDNCQFSASATLNANQARIVLPGNDSPRFMVLQHPTLISPGLEATIADGHLSLETQTGTQLSLPQGTHPLFSFWNAEATARSVTRMDLTLSDMNGFHLTAETVDASMPLLRFDEHMLGFQLNVRDLDTQPLDPSRLTATLTLRNFYTNLISLNFWDAVLTTDLSLGNRIVSLDGSIAINEHLTMFAEARHNLVSRNGQGRLQIPDVSFHDPGNRLTDIITPLPVTADILSGSISGQAELLWHWPESRTVPVVTGSVDAHLENISGYFESSGLVELNTRIHARLEEDLHLRSLSEEHLRIGRLDVGLGIEDLETRYVFDTAGPALTLSEAGLTVFGGRVRADRLDYDARLPSNTNTLILDRIDIASVLSLSAYEGVTATGIINGEIPLTISGTQFTVDAGRLSALPPGGTISYRDGPTDTGNPSLDLVYSALRNYRYTRLDADVDYLADGELLLSVRMEGVAPDVGDGQRINLNVNISDNIPVLLESLQAGRNIAESLRNL